MTYHSKYGVWKIVYNYVPTTGRYAATSHEEYKNQKIEMQLELNMFKEADELIARIKSMPLPD